MGNFHRTIDARSISGSAFLLNRDGLLFAAEWHLHWGYRRMLQDMVKSCKIWHSISIAVNMNSHKLPGYHMLSMDMQGHSHMSHMGRMGHMYRLHVYRTRQLIVSVSVSAMAMMQSQASDGRGIRHSSQTEDTQLRRVENVEITPMNGWTTMNRPDSHW